MEAEDEVESRKKMDEQRKRLQRQLRVFEKHTDLPQDVQGSLKERWQRQEPFAGAPESAEEVSKETEHQETCKRKLLPLRRRCGGSERNSLQKMSAFSFRQTRSIRIKCQGQNWKQSFEVCRQGRKEEAATVPKSLNAALIRWESSFALWEWKRRSISSIFCARRSSKIRGLYPPANARKRRRKGGK